MITQSGRVQGDAAVCALQATAGTCPPAICSMEPVEDVIELHALVAFLEPVGQCITLHISCMARRASGKAWVVYTHAA